MQKYKLKIADTKEKKDLTIIYKENKDKIHEIKTSKEDLLKTLHYFEQKRYEIDLTNLIYIEEEVEFDIFNDFIASIKTKEVDVDQNNYIKYLYLSDKYQYDELKYTINEFRNERPDVKNIIYDIEAKKEKRFLKEEEEELIATNLDICLLNGHLKRLPLSAINRILNSPKRIINNHHLLFSFVIEKIREFINNENKNEEDEEEVFILPSSLDFCSMTKDEISELFRIEGDSKFFSPRKSNDFIKILIDEDKKKSNEIMNLEERISQLEQKEAKCIQELEALVKQNTKIICANEKKSNEIMNLEERISQLEQKEAKCIQELEALVKQNTKIICVNEKKDNEIMKLEEKISQLEQKESKCNQELEALNKQIEIIKEEQKSGEAVQSIQLQKLEISHANLLKPTAEISKKLDELHQKEEKEKYEIKKFEQESGNEFNGIMRLLYKERRIEVTSNSIDEGNPMNLVDFDETNIYCSNDSILSTICFDFKNCLVQPSSYSIRTADSPSNRHLKNWVVEVSNDKNYWIEIDRHENDPTLNKSLITHTFIIAKPLNEFYRFIRLRQTGKSWYIEGNNNMLLLRCLEFHGLLKEPINR